MSKLGFDIEIARNEAGVVPEAVEDRIIEVTDELLEKIKGVIDRCGSAFIETAAGSATAPNEIGVEFGIDARGEAGIPLVTKGSLGANFKITIKWKKG